MRAEECKNKVSAPKKKAVKESSGGGGGGDSKKDEDDELKKALDGVIVREKPNIRFSDVAGLENAKELYTKLSSFQSNSLTCMKR